MNKIKVVLAILFSLLFSINVFAATVTMSDGDLVNYNPGDDYVFAASLTVADPMVTFGFTVEMGELFYITVTAPPEFDLYALQSTLPDLGGITLNSFDSEMTVFAGTSYTLPFNGDNFVGYNKWMTIFVDGNQVALDWIAANGGSLSLSGVAPGTDVAAVPVPPAVWLFGSGLLGLVGASRRSRSKTKT